MAENKLNINKYDFCADTSSLNKGEDLYDTLNNLSAIGVDTIVMRHTNDELINLLALKTYYNELSFIILDVFDKLRITTPKIQLKIADNTPVELLNKALDMVRRGNSSLVFVSENALRNFYLSVGLSVSDISIC